MPTGSLPMVKRCRGTGGTPGLGGVYGAINDSLAVGDGCWAILDWASAADDSTVAAPSVSAKIVFIVVLRILICDACATVKITR